MIMFIDQERERERTAPIVPTSRIALAGDILVREALGQPALQDPPALLAGLAPVFAESDLVFANLECPLTDASERNPMKDSSSPFFRNPPKLVEAIADGGINILSLANNHTMDFGITGLTDTLTALTGAGISSVGAGLDERSARQPVVRAVHGRRIGFLAYANTDYAGSRQAGCAPARANVMVHDVRRLRRQVDLLVVSIHQGVIYSHIPALSHMRLARQLVKAGADVVVGHHPHVVQGWERYKQGWIFYSLGSLVFDITPDEARRDLENSALCRAGLIDCDPQDQRSREGLIVRIVLGSRDMDVEIIPVVQPFLEVPRLAAGAVKERIFERLRQDSKTMLETGSQYRRTLEETLAAENLAGVRRMRPVDVLRRLHRVRPRHLRSLLTTWRTPS